jgi:hypothetical protein
MISILLYLHQFARTCAAFFFFVIQIPNLPKHREALCDTLHALFTSAAV